jgi:rhodanese-related sulfurtransferase
MKCVSIAYNLRILIFIMAIASGFQNSHAQLSRDESELAAYIIMPEELLHRIRSGSEDYVLVDVREREAYRVSHITGALNLPWEDGTFEERYGDLPRDKTVILISSEGNLALKALRVLLMAEYKNLESSFRETLSVEGGMDNWPYREYLVSK